MGDSGSSKLWWTWSWRDLRQHWIAVLSIGLVIAIGTGVYAGLGSTAAWRRISNDESFGALRMHDLRVTMSPGTFAPSGTLVAAAGTAEHASWIDAADERLVVDTQIDASTGGDAILVSARLIGADYASGDAVDDLWVADGSFDPGAPEPQAVLETKFAEYYELPSAGSVTLAGGRELSYTGLGVAPEEFYVIGPQGSILAQADMANLYLQIEDAQAVTGRSAQVNDLVLRLDPAADRDVVEGELVAAVASLGASVTTRDDAEAYRVLYEDIENDQQIWNALSALVLGAAALAAFNLISRIVEAQRREIGIGMALGVDRRRLAIRPLLVGLQVGVLGTVAGIAVGAAIGGMMRDLMETIVPLPYWRSPFQAGVFLRGAVLGVVPPLLASIVPVWRAVRVEPIEAIRTGHLAVTSRRLGGWTRRVRLPGSSFRQLPLRNLLRAPRRTVMTALGVGAAITALVAVLAMLDSFGAAIDRGTAEATKGDPERVVVGLDTYYPVDAPVVGDVLASPAVGEAALTLQMPASVGAPDRDDIDLVLQVLDLDGSLWAPTVVDEAASGAGSGLLLTRKAVRDLGIAVGDQVVLRHPQRSASGLALVDTPVIVAGTHPNPVRTFAYLDDRFADDFGVAGFANGVHVTPAPGLERSDVQRAMFAIDGVGSAQPVARIGEAFDEALRQFVGFLVIAAGAVLLMAVLIAFNSARISADERRREHASMLAFGVPVRRVVGLMVREAIVVGVLATAIGVAAGTIVLRWMLASLASRTLPDFDIPPAVSPTTLAVAAAVGVVSVGIAPVFLARRLRRMDLPDTLRVME